MTLPGGKPGNIGVKIVTTESYPNAAADTTKLPIRWANAEKQLLGNCLARLPNDIPRRREEHSTALLNARDKLGGYHWASARNEAIFKAKIRIAESGPYPGPDAVIAELRRINNLEAADFAAELAREYWSDAELLVWAAQCLELGRACEAYSAAERIQAKLDAGQSMADAGPEIAKLHAAATPAEPPRSILDLCHNVAGLLSDPKPLAEPIIDGGLRRGEVGLWVGGTKTAKSWSIMHWHIAVATGGQCFEYPCRRGPSLMIDCELALSTNTHRLKRVAELYGEPDVSSIELVSFRENPITIDGLIPMLERVPPRRFDFITIDPIFKLLPPDADENNNAFIASFFARLIALATKLDCAILCVHHTSKGLQSGKAISDLGAGAGAQSRAVDWHCGLREHAEAGCVSLHTLCRSFPPSEPSVWELTPPSMTARTELDPDALKQPKPRKAKSAEPAPEKPEKPNWETIAKLANEDPHDAAWFAANVDLSERKITELLRQAAAKKRLHLWRPKNPRDPHQWATVPQPLTG